MRIIRSRASVLALVILTATAAGASAQAAMPATVAKTAAGPILVDAKGMTLYTFDKDVQNSSVCNGECAVAWPPLPAAAGAEGSGDWSLVKRDDGSSQWAYKNKPLYTWVKDTKPGDTTGDGVKEVWHIATP